MPLVSDADIIIHLAKLEKLSILQLLYDEISIPEYVKNELLNKEFKDNNDIKKAINKFIKIYPVSIQKANQIAKEHNIHIGEAHVKALGEKLKSNYFLSNEKKVRKAAKEQGFNVVGTIGIILKVNKLGIIKKSETIDLLEKMKGQGFRIHPELIQKAEKVVLEMTQNKCKKQK